jgi:hypothetical protein
MVAFAKLSRKSCRYPIRSDTTTNEHCNYTLVALLPDESQSQDEKYYAEGQNTMIQGGYYAGETAGNVCSLDRAFHLYPD